MGYNLIEGSEGSSSEEVGCSPQSPEASGTRTTGKIPLRSLEAGSLWVRGNMSVVVVAVLLRGLRNWVVTAWQPVLVERQERGRGREGV